MKVNDQKSDRVRVAAGEFLHGRWRRNPHRAGKKLRVNPFDRYTARVGVYRVIYRIDDAVRVVSVAPVGHRADVYRG